MICIYQKFEDFMTFTTKFISKTLEVPKIGSRIIYGKQEFQVCDIVGTKLVFATRYGKKYVEQRYFALKEPGLFEYLDPTKYRVKYSCEIAQGAVTNFSGKFEYEFTTLKNPKAAARGSAMYKIKESNQSMDIKLFAWLEKLGKIKFEILNIEEIKD
jgi:hypothetical protein